MFQLIPMASHRLISLMKSYILRQTQPNMHEGSIRIHPARHKNTIASSVVQSFLFQTFSITVRRKGNFSFCVLYEKGKLKRSGKIFVILEMSEIINQYISFLIRTINTKIKGCNLFQKVCVYMKVCMV
jgi:hypothetical protein